MPWIIDRPACPSKAIRLGLRPGNKELHPRAAQSRPGAPKHSRIRVLTSFAAPTEHDLSALREKFDPRARWRSAIARALSRFASYKGADHHDGS